ncbi:MAG: BatA domain-containing protein [Vicinamibacterales bacterium]
MIWTNPLAWLGLAAIAVPLLVHLLSRQTSRAVPFPTLRFLRATPVVNLRRRRVSDIPLLLVRAAIVALAVAALAQPHLTISSAPDANHIAIIDTSASVARNSSRLIFPGSETATRMITIERKDLRGALAEAATWLRAHPGRNTVLVVSDFRRGTLDAARFATLPAETGISLLRVPTLTEPPARISGVSSWSIEGLRTRATWGGAEDAPDIEVAARAGDAAIAAAIKAAALATAPAATGQLRPVTFVMPASPQRATLLASSSPANEPWMFALFAAMDARRVESVRVVDGRATVFLESDDPATAAAAIGEAIPALALGPPVQELEPMMIPDEELRRLERAPQPPSVAERPSVWMGRWFWITALLLLAVEGLMRRTRAPASEAHAHAA